MKRSNRHPLEVTSDRLLEASEKYADQLTGEERDMIGRLRDKFERIAEQRIANAGARS